ncbi:MAG: M28 family peptidase [Phycisphaerales bacterium]
MSRRRMVIHMSRQDTSTRDADAIQTPRPKWRFRLVTRGALKRIGVFAAVVLVLGVAGWWWMIRMPGERFSGPAPGLTVEQVRLREALRRDVERLASGVGVRSFMQPRKLGDAVAWIMDELNVAGYATIEEVWVPAGAGAEAVAAGASFERETVTPNLEVTVVGTSRAREIIVVGAHYDSYYMTPGADDNASGVAGTLALARRFANSPQERTLRFVFFVNEEPPHFQKETMGSLVYARRCRARGDDVRAAIVLESIGYFSDAPGSQPYPPPLGMFYPDRGDFVAFVGNLASRGLVHRAISSFRARATVGSEGAAAPSFLPGIDWSDHWSFWQVGYPAVMVTCTAVYRNPHYHKATDVPGVIDYDRFTRAMDALAGVVVDLANGE